MEGGSSPLAWPDPLSMHYFSLIPTYPLSMYFLYDAAFLRLLIVFPGALVIQVTTMSALHGAAQVQKANLQALNIDRVDQVLDDINEANEQMQQIQQALGAPTGLSSGLDEDELLGELEELDAAQLDEELLEPAPVPTTKVPADKLPSAPNTKIPAKQPAKTQEELELEALQAEMEAL